MDTKPKTTKQLTAIRIDRADMETLARIAIDSGRSVASCVREAVKEWIRARTRKARKAAAEDTTAPF